MFIAEIKYIFTRPDENKIFILFFQINISILQASIVEEVISFSALDNLRDLTCVSLLALCVDDVTAHFHFGKQVIVFACSISLC